LNTSQSIKELALAMHKAQVKIKAALKDSTNPHFRSKYADLSSVVEAVKPALNSEGIVFLQGVSGIENGVAVETMLLHVSGEWMSSTLEIPASKHDAQGYGSAITYGRRYGLQAMCGVPAEDDDGNAATASAPLRKAIPANAGAGDDLDADQKKMVEKTRDGVVVALNENRDFDAYGLCESLTDDMLAEKLYLWSLLDSKQRSRLKKQADAAKQKAA
jgi:hypothetical protein